MAIVIHTYTQVPQRLVDHTIDILNDTVVARLVTSSYVFDPDHTVAADLGGNEISGGGYEAASLDGISVTPSAITVSSPPSWDAFSGTWRYIVITALSGGTEYLLCLFDLIEDQTADNEPYTPGFTDNKLFYLARH